MKVEDLLAPFLFRKRVGYFSMEIALRPEIPTYSGGLGMLAGDTLRSAADLQLPMVGVTLVSRRGYFRQVIDAAGRQAEYPDDWDPAHWAVPLPAKISVTIEGRDVWIIGWLYVVEGVGGGREPVVLLDTDLPENAAADRGLTDYLYGGDQAYRLKQEIVLGIGGVRLLDALGFRIAMYHLNEGHSALLTVELLRRLAHETRQHQSYSERYDFQRVRELCHFTTHTPIDAGHDQFSYDLVGRVLGHVIDDDVLRRIAGNDVLNTLRLALNLSDYVNGVGKRHAETAHRLYPEYAVNAISNGIHSVTWTHSAIAELFDQHIPGWTMEPELLIRAQHAIPDPALWAAHQAAKRELLNAVRTRTGVELDPDLPIIGYARRMTRYKRPDLLFTDLERLRRIAARQPLQIVVAGKAHPSDAPGKRAIEFLHEAIRELTGYVSSVFVPDYDMAFGKPLVAGVDLWLNTPEPPLEASGTSGMKAAVNGVPSFSVLDGWWVEGHIEGVTGWSIGDGTAGHDHSDAESLYGKLENVILPCYDDRARWIAVMKNTISCNASVFHSHRMMRRYAAEAYMR